MCDNKYIPIKEAEKFYCVTDRMRRCAGSDCAGWKWSGCLIKHGVYAREQEDGTIHNVNEEIITVTHGCCGRIYPGDIILKEIKE